MNYNPRNIVAFSLLLFVTLIICGTLLAQDRHKPLNPKAARLQMSVPEVTPPHVVMTFCADDTLFMKARIAVIDSALAEIKRLRAEKSALSKMIAFQRKYSK